MKCAICRHGSTSPGAATVTLHRADTVIVIREVPAEICGNCGEYYLSDPVTQEILELAERAVERGVEVEVLRYAA